MKRDLFEKKETQTVSKHNILGNYLKPWIVILSSRTWVRKLYYVDAFAGTGRFATGEEGSPVIGGRLLKECGKPRVKRCCICVEKNTERARTLEDELNEFRDEIEVKIYPGEFDDRIDEMMNGIREAPAFFFIDPEGFSGMSFSSIERILAFPRKEVLINFQYNAIQRWLKAKKVEKTMLDLFGTDECMEIVKGGLRRSEKEKALIELYKSQLRSKGYYVWYFRNRFPRKNRTFYYLVYATQNLTGFKIMKEVIFEEESRRYFEPNLFKEIEFAEFQKNLLEKYKGTRICYEEILAYVLQETDYLRKDLDSVIRNAKIKKDANPEQTKNPWLVFSGSYGNISCRTFHIRDTGAHLATPKIAARRPKVLWNEKGLAKRVADGSIIKRFDRTPYPVKATDVVCPHFLELKWAYGCSFDCSWCYLKGTFRFRPEGIRPAYKPLDKIKLHTETFLEEVKTPEILNTGEIADSLMKENGDSPFSKFIVPMFEAQKRHKVLFVTKSSNVKNLVEISSHRQSIISFTLNAFPVANRWEKGAPSVEKRMQAAKKVADAGYEVRIRIDPMVPIKGWRKHYIQLVDELFPRLVPDRITLGSLRGLQSTINNTNDTSWVEYLKETSNWGRKIDFATRYKIYKAITEHLNRKYDYYDVALCKETKAMWEELRMDWRKIRCNCVW